MDGILTLPERRRLRREAMRAALPQLDAALAAYGRAHGGRFIRYGSSAAPRFDLGSDVDLIADFPPGEDVAAWRFAEESCHALGLVPDLRPAPWCSDALLRRASGEGVTLP